MMGYCSSSASTAAKTVILPNFTLQTGVVVYVKMRYNNTVASTTLNVNSTGAKSIYKVFSNTAMTANDS